MKLQSDSVATDFELLAFAAKAIGVELRENMFEEADYYHVVGNDCVGWNPLINDGDAHRLAVRLQLTVCNEHVSAGTSYCTKDDESYPLVRSGDNEDHVVDSDYAATRRAIVLAAAEIGRNMK